MFYPYARRQYSAHGEDGLLDWLWGRAVRAQWSDPVGPERFVCEFGAHDGKQLSNTYHLIFARGFSGLYIEADATRFAALERTARSHPGLAALQASVGWDDSDEDRAGSFRDHAGAAPPSAIVAAPRSVRERLLRSW